MIHTCLKLLDNKQRNNLQTGQFIEAALALLARVAWKYALNNKHHATRDVVIV